MATETQTEQSENIIGRDQIGRDLTTVNNYISNNNHFAYSRAAIPIIKNLLKRFEEERQKNIRLDTFIDELDYYNKRIEGDVLGLEQKLSDGNYEPLVGFALKAKERFHKKLFKFQFSESAQLINAHLLSWVQTRFELYIYPKITRGCSPDEVCSLVDKFIVTPLLAELEDDVLGYTSTEISGMLYYLTGNCHIKWTK